MRDEAVSEAEEAVDAASEVDEDYLEDMFYDDPEAYDEWYEDNRVG